MKMKILTLVLIGTVLLCFRTTVSAQAQQLYCPGQTVELSCEDPIVVIWKGTAFTGQCPSENDTITVIAAEAVVGNTTTCGKFTANVTSLTPGTFGSTILDVSLTFEADVSLNGTTVECEDSNPTNVLELNQLLNVPATTTPTLMLSQNSQSMVGVAFAIDDIQCVTNYHVNVTQEGGPTTSVSGSSSPVIVGDLDLCRYNYSFVGYTTSMTGVVSGVSASLNFMVNLTALNGIINVTINTVDPLIKWTQIDSTLYPTCITDYVVADQGNQSLTTTVTSNVTSLTAQQLNAAGFPYCISILPTVTPLTPMGPLATAVGSSNLIVVDPDFPTPMLTYSFALVNQSENFTGVVVLRVTVQNITGSLVETTTYNYMFIATMSSSITFTGNYFEIELPEGEEGRENVSVTVEFVYGQCMSSMSAEFTVPEKNITGITQGQPTDTSHTVTITLPLTAYQPEELLIISTVEPSNGNPIMANFSRPVMQYSVTFDNLMAATSYMFTIRIVLRANNAVDAVSAVTDTFTTLMTPTTTPPLTTMAPTTTPSQTPSQPTGAPQGCGGGCIAGIIVGFLFVLVLVVIIIVVVLCYWSKTRKSGGMKVSHEMEEQSDKLTPSHGDQVDPVSDSPPTETFKNPDSAADKSPDVIPGNEDVEAGPDSNALIYADLDMATKGKNKAKVDATVTPTGGAEGHEAVEYASIEHFKKSDKSEGDEDN